MIKLPDLFKLLTKNKEMALSMAELKRKFADGIRRQRNKKIATAKHGETAKP